MTGQDTAQIHWRALDRAGEDRCRLVQAEGGHMLIGHARFSEVGRAVALDYVVRIDAGWMTIGADVTGTDGDRAVALKIARTDQGWTLNGVGQKDLARATDIDLAFTPATNLMPLRRLSEVGRLETCAAWLADLKGPLVPLDQRYTRGRGDIVHYEAAQTGTVTDLRVSPEGFVTAYPGHWEADHAP